MISIEDDGERAALLPDAFTPAEQPAGPPGGTGASEAGPASPSAPAVQPQTGATAKAQDSADAAAEAGLETLVAAGAFEPSALGSNGVGDSSVGVEEEVQLSTTALRLLNAVDARFSAVQKVGVPLHAVLTAAPQSSESTACCAYTRPGFHISGLQCSEGGSGRHHKSSDISALWCFISSERTNLHALSP